MIEKKTIVLSLFFLTLAFIIGFIVTSRVKMSDNTKKNENSESFSLSKDVVNLIEGNEERVEIISETNDSISDELEWSSSDDNVATVEDGIIAAKSEGTAKITVQSKKNASREITVNVEKNNKDILLNKSSAVINIGDILELKVLNTSDSLIWSSSDEKIASVSNDGVVKALNVGKTVIEVKMSNGKTATCNIEVIDKNKGKYIEPLKTNFEITYYWGIPANEITESRIDDMKNVGMTIAHLRGDDSKDIDAYRKEMAKAINMLNEKGIKVLVVDRQTLNNKLKECTSEEQTNKTRECYDDTKALSIIKEIVDFYSKFTNVIGYEIEDEPSVDNFNRLAKIVSYIKQNDPKRLAYINLFPNYANSTQLGTSSYIDYLEKFINVVKPEILSIDHYPSMFHGESIDSSKKELYSNEIDLVNIYSKYPNVLPMTISLVTNHWIFNRTLSENEIAFEISVNLAFGMKRLSYYTYSIDALAASNAFVDKNYDKTKHYYDIQGINNWAKNIGKELYDKNVLDVYGVNEVSSLVNNNKLKDYNDSDKPLGNFTLKRFNSEAPSSALITVFNDKKTFLLVNTDFSNEQGIFKLDNELENYQWFDPIDNKWKNIDDEAGNNRVWLMPLSNRIAIVPGHCLLIREK